MFVVYEISRKIIQTKINKNVTKCLGKKTNSSFLTIEKSGISVELRTTSGNQH